MTSNRDEVEEANQKLHGKHDLISGNRPFPVFFSFFFFFNLCHGQVEENPSTTESAFKFRLVKLPSLRMIF